MLNLLTRYPGKVGAITADYPQGEPQNITAPSDGTGTPWDKDIVKDIYGFFAKVVTDAAVVPSNSPETANVSQILEALTALLQPVGSGLTHFGNTPPTGYLVRDGSAVNRVGIYAALFAVIGTTYGVGDGATTFNLPPSDDRFDRGWVAGNPETFGSVHAATNVGHNHPIVSVGADGSGGATGVSVISDGQDLGTIDTYIAPSGATDGAPAHIYVLQCIKY